MQNKELKAPPTKPITWLVRWPKMKRQKRVFAQVAFTAARLAYPAAAFSELEIEPLEKT